MSRDNHTREEIMANGGKMNDDDMDRILLKQDEILPSSGFAASVMEAVRREACRSAANSFPLETRSPWDCGRNWSR